MNVLSLFSGIGGIDLGLERAGMRVVAQCEADPFCRAVLRKHWPDVPYFDDVRTLSGSDVRDVDLIAGGFPCQDVSAAGKGAGIGGARSGLWREMARLVGECRPAWVLVENVPALRTRGADRVLADLEALGYDAWPLVVGAWAVGAPHRRDRVWIVAHADGGRREGERLADRKPEHEGASRREPDGRDCSGVADDDGTRLREPGEGEAWSQRDARRDSPRDCGGGVADAERDAVREQSGRLGGTSRSGAAVDREPRAGELADAPRVRRDGSERATDQGLGRWHDEIPAPREGSFWPARPGEPQHDWEAPRLVEFPMGSAAAGIPVRLVRAANRHALRAFGNAVVPQVVEAIGRAILKEVSL